MEKNKKNLVEKTYNSLMKYINQRNTERGIGKVASPKLEMSYDPQTTVFKARAFEEVQTSYLNFRHNYKWRKKIVELGELEVDCTRLIKVRSKKDASFKREIFKEIDKLLLDYFR